MTWTLGAEHFAKLRTVHHRFLLRVISFQRRQHADYTILSYAKALQKTRRESIETTIRKRRLIFAGAVVRQSKGRLPSQVMFATITGGEGRRPGGQPKNWHNGCLVEDLRVFRAKEGSTEHCPFNGWSLELRPGCGPLQLRRRASGAGGSPTQPSGSWLGGTRMKRI